MEISIQALKKQYRDGKTALNQINLTIGVGMFGLLGPNGAGKSTLMQILATVLGPTSGQVDYDNYRLGKDDHQIRQIIGYLPQTLGLYDKLTGEEFLNYIALLKGVKDSKKRRLVVHEMLDKVNLADKAKLRIKTYSGGMKQRIGIAQALIGDPKVMIVDEPTAGLDPEERIRFRDLLEELGLERTILLSTHIVADIETSCRALAIMDRGRIVFQGSIEELMGRVEDKVWVGMMEAGEYRLFAGSSRIVSRRKTFAGYEIRMVSDSRPDPGFVSAKPGLEDAYILLTGSDDHA
ncbi:ABC transporter ATP-binding protein [Paenibacillus eucommiae]|uniref:ABC-type multidrug transport system ATPase subunit n=1 Tax=Paenibacillus eucommiae TaxID=1355755 RepID=A0ABS4JAT1_9BACL|nr:ABC transporter ATP-binding protein [Paenibacillus eucommiae]MBP1996340.1 ABC-type multidrug transport system ATPase subunit [Paenibacillus eucommiae]